MSARKGKREQEEELAAYLEAHKDEGDWEEVELQRPTRVSGVYSIRFTTQELDALQAEANREGKRISQIVREAVSQYLVNQREQKLSNIIDWVNKQFVSYTGPIGSPVTSSARINVRVWQAEQLAQTLSA